MIIRDPLLHHHNVLPAVFLARFGIHRNLQRRTEPLVKAVLELGTCLGCMLAQLRTVGEQTHPHQKGPGPAIADGMRRSVVGQEAQQRHRQPLVAAVPGFIHAHVVRYLDERLDLGLAQVPLTHKGPRFGIQQQGIQREEPLQRAAEPRRPLSRYQHQEGTAPDINGRGLSASRQKKTSRLDQGPFFITEHPLQQADRTQGTPFIGGG